MKQIKFLEPVKAVLNKDYKTSDDFNPFDSESIIYTGKFEENEHGEYEIVKVKKGSHIRVTKAPNGLFDVIDASGYCCGKIKENEFTLVEENMEFSKDLTLNKHGLWKK